MTKVTFEKDYLDGQQVVWRFRGVHSLWRNQEEIWKTCPAETI